MDVAGRRVAARELDGAGWQEVDLTAPRRIGPGLHFARLKRGDQTRTTTVIVGD